MSAIEMLLQELNHEARATRRVLERVPEDRLGWKPHDRSMSLGQLALHVAVVPGAIAEMSQRSPFPVPQGKHSSPTSARQLLETLDQSLDKARQILGGIDDAALANAWRRRAMSESESSTNKITGSVLSCPSILCRCPRPPARG